MIMKGGNGSARRETRPIDTLYITYLTWNDPKSNPRLRHERPATNRLSTETDDVF